MSSECSTRSYVELGQAPTRCTARNLELSTQLERNVDMGAYVPHEVDLTYDATVERTAYSFSPCICNIFMLACMGGVESVNAFCI